MNEEVVVVSEPFDHLACVSETNTHSKGLMQSSKY